MGQIFENFSKVGGLPPPRPPTSYAYAHEDKIHEHIEKSLLLGREIFLAVFIRFCRFSKGAFCRKSPISMDSNFRLKPGKLQNLIGLIGNKARHFQCYYSDIQGEAFFKRRTFLWTHPVIAGTFTVLQIL